MNNTGVITQPPSNLTVQVNPNPAPFVSNCPAGLEYLAVLDGLYVKQLLEVLEIFTGIETNNRYEVMDGYGRRLFFAAEETDQCVTYCGGRLRPFIIQLLNFFGSPILTLTRECTCMLCSGCVQCGGNKVDVTHISGEYLGSGTQIYHACDPYFEITDATGQPLFKINGPSCAECCRCMMGPCCTADFQVFTTSGTQIGLIQKKASMKEFVSDANTFGVNFPIDLEPKAKALILGAVFLIDFGYFESGGHSRNYG